MPGRCGIPSVDGMVVLLADPPIARIPVRDCGDPLVDLAEYGIAYSGPSPSGAFVRAGLAERLAAAQESLPADVRLVVNEGHRSSREQARILARYARTLRAQYPGIDELTLRRMSSRFVAPLDVAPHVAAAAVDLTLADANGPRWMGTPIDATPEESRDACVFAATTIGPEARANRDLLARVLGAAGLVNYPTEWWHWSYGDRYWAYVTGADHAVYGAIDASRAA